ncbi:hypothetical protein IVA83_20965 [Bradyrhizobium sp. 143]|nr:hypothetical protein [Bradyrhizobium sp. 143]MCK1725063.1 hypothetical protein [Bradyrhizobium sp. 142]
MYQAYGCIRSLPNPWHGPCKLETWLRIAGIPYEVAVTTNPRKGPRGKLPFVDDGGVIVADTTIIIDRARAASISTPT